MRGIRVLAGLLTVLIGSSMSEGAAQAFGGNQQGAQGAAESLLSLDGLYAGPLSAVVQTQTAAGFDVKLSIAPQLMSPLFYTTWFGPALQGQKPMKTVRITAFTRTGSPSSALEATGVAPRQIDLPALDAANHELIKFSVSFSAPGMRPVQPAAVQPAAGQAANQSQTHLFGSHFRLAFQGNPLLDGSRVSKIEALSVSPKGGAPVIAGPLKSQAVGSRSLAPEIKNMTGPGGATISNLVFFIAQTSVAPFQQWLATSPNQTRNGSITYLKQTMTPWGTLDLRGLAITKITMEPGSGRDGISWAKVEMTVGSLQLTLAP